MQPPAHFEGTAVPEYSSDGKTMFRQMYFEAINLITNAVKDRFNQPGFELYCNLEDLLLRAFSGKN